MPKRRRSKASKPRALKGLLVAGILMILSGLGLIGFGIYKMHLKNNEVIPPGGGGPGRGERDGGTTGGHSGAPSGGGGARVGTGNPGLQLQSLGGDAGGGGGGSDDRDDGDDEGGDGGGQ